MRYLIAMFATLVGLVPTAVFAQEGSLSLRPGEQAAVFLSSGEQPRITVSALSEAEQISTIEWMLQRQEATGPSSVRDIPTVASDVLRITFLNLGFLSGSNERLLLVENGYDGVLRYRAVIFSEEASGSTSVCTVFPMMRSVEHWPHPIDRIDLSGLALEPFHEGDSIACE